MNQPLALALNALPTFWASLACFERIQEYLLRDERKDFRLHQSANPAISLSGGSSSNLALRDESGTFHQESNSINMTGLSRVYEGQQISTLVKIRDASFGWDDTKCILRGVELEFLAGRCYVVSDPVGSGKSTLLRAVLGETRCFEGSITVMAASIAFCDQDPWVSNTSIQENIVAGEPFDERLYRRVITACVLEQDFSELVDGDQTLLDSKGTRLSGGQIKRIALARAAYSRRSLVLLDDCFSSIDPKTENEVFSRLLGPRGLFTDLGCCVVLATQRLKQPFKEAQRLFVDQNGQIQNLNAADVSPEPAKGLYLDNGASEGGTESGMEGPQGPGNIYPTSNPRIISEPKADTARQMGDSTVYRFYITKIGVIHCLVYLFLNILTAFFPRFSQAWVSFWVKATADDPSRHTNALYGSAYALISLGVLVTFYLVMLYMFQVMVPRSARKLHEEQLHTVIRAPYSFLSRTDSGLILNRFSQDMTLIDLELPSYAVQAFFYVFSCLGQGILVATGIKYMAVLIPGVLVIVYALQKFYLRTSRKIRFLDLEAKSPLYSHMMETCEGLLTVRAFGWEKRFTETNTTLVNASQRPLYSLYCIQRWLNLVLALLVAGICTLLVALGTQLRRETNGNSMGVALVNVINFAQSLASLIEAWASLETSLGAVSRIKSFTTDVKAEDDCIGRTNISDARPSHPAEAVQHGKVEFIDASFSYEEHGDHVLRDLSVIIEPGSRVGICGRSGSGKSSLLLALLRMLHPCGGGGVRIHGHDTMDMTIESLRSAFIVLPQTPILMPGSVRTNLDPYSSSTSDHDDLIISVLAQMGIWDVIHEQGDLDAELGFLTLSHGQAQLFAIARAILDKYIHKTHKIVLLDEVTNGLDSKTSSLVMGSIHHAFHGHTIIAIAHQLDTILDYDRVLVLSSGQVVENGVPRELLGRPRGWFRGLWESGVP